jgi:hypothetical protein
MANFQQWGVRGWGGGRSWPPLSHLLEAGVRGEGEGREKREQIRPCTKCSLHACSFTLCLSFSYLRSAVAASFDIKKFHRNATDTYSKGKVYCFPKAMIKAFLREKNLKCPVFIYNQSTHVQYN